MNAKKCDWCYEHYDIYNQYSNDHNKPNTIVINNDHANAHKGMICGKYDLCPSCMRRVLKLMDEIKVNANA